MMNISDGDETTSNANTNPPSQQNSSSNNTFLSDLRASSGGVRESSAEIREYSGALGLVATSNDDTLSAGNTEKHRRAGFSNLSDLFDGPPSHNAPIHSDVVTPRGPSPAPSSRLLPLPKPPPAAAAPVKAFNTGRDSASALPPRPPPVHHHNRAVSWGKVDFKPPANDSTPSRHLQQPSLDSSTTFSSMDGDGSWNQHHNRTASRARILSLEDILQAGPFEQEAETHILKALEHDYPDQYNRPRLDTSTSSLLSQVPESASHDFTMSPVSTDGVDENTASGSPERNNDTEEDDTGNQSPQASMRSKRSGEQQQMKPLLQAHRTPMPSHNRHISVEQSLFEMMTAMSAIHDEKPTHVNNRSPDIGDSAHSSGEDQLTGSADNFAHNAVLLSRVQEEAKLPPATTKGKDQRDPLQGNLSAAHVDEEAHTNTPASRAKDRWDLLRGNLPSLREDDSHELNPDNSEPKNHQENVESKAEVEYGEPEDVEEALHGASVGTNAGSNSGRGRQNNRRSSVFAVANDKIKEDWELWRAFFRPRRENMWTYIKTVLFYLMLPAGGIAAILFYGFENPPTGKRTAETDSQDGASASWWLLFICVRQVLTFSLALGMQGFIIDFLALGSRLMLRLVGPVITLLIITAKGWPFIVFWWAVLDFAMLHGDGAFAKHWAFWQETIDMFNSSNPSGNIVSNEWNTRILSIAMSVSVVVAVKRFIVGLYLGRQTFSHFGESLAKVMKKMLLISQVAGFAKEIEKDSAAMDMTIPVTSKAFGWNREYLRGIVFVEDDTDDATTPSKRDFKVADNVIDTSRRDPSTGSLHSSEKLKLMQLLEEWEEPDRRLDRNHNGRASISAVLHFRKALAFIQKRYPFSFAFGPAYSREACIESSQAVYGRLMLGTPSEVVLPFETIALLALTDTSEIDQQKAKDLVKLFRPDRQGYLTVLDFVKSVDSVYKEFRLLSASIENSSRIDRAFENLFNILFYALVATMILIQLDFDPLALFLSLSSVILAFAFMIGSASAKYFEGLLFILVRRPYGIGDRIHISNVEKDTNFTGSAGWVVENVTLFETTAIWGPTKERCSLSNGSMANSRIINGARSPQAQFWIFLRMPIDTPFEKIRIFKTAIAEYLKARPREWLSLNGFRAHKIVADKGFIEYALVVQHREKWQNIGQLLDSKANLQSYCLEVAKQLNVHYHAPPLPVDLKYSPAIPIAEIFGNESASMNDEARAEMFRSLALNTNMAG